MSDDRVARILLTQEIATFLYAEAELLDERRHDEWLALLAEDIRYWMPMRRNVKFGDTTREFTRETEDVSWFDEGKDTLTRRVKPVSYTHLDVYKRQILAPVWASLRRRSSGEWPGSIPAWRTVTSACIA